MRLHDNGMKDGEIGFPEGSKFTCHYQIFENLPVEKHGSAENSCSWLHDEWVKIQTCNWLTTQRTGEVTPCWLQHALNGIILLKLNISLLNSISEHTACQWLIKLGWHQTLVQKGVYMDGHEREDKIIMPEPEEGTLRIIIQYHDECCFHANDKARNFWVRPGEQPFRKMSQGRLIHVSDFINEEDGRLVL